MRRPSLLVWVVFCVWALWLCGLQGLLATSDAFASWTPELGLVLVFALRADLPRGERRAATAFVAATRVAFSTEPVLAVFAVYLGVSGVLELLRRSLEVDRPLARAVFAGAATLAGASFWMVCRHLALFEEGIVAPVVAPPWRGALATALLVGLALPAVRRLPGARPLLGASA